MSKFLEEELPYVIGFILFIAFCGIVAWFIVTSTKTVGEAYEANKAYKKYLETECKVVGFYGRSGEHKVFNCNGTLVKE